MEIQFEGLDWVGVRIEGFSGKLKIAWGSETFSIKAGGLYFGFGWPFPRLFKSPTRLICKADDDLRIVDNIERLTHKHFPKATRNKRSAFITKCKSVINETSKRLPHLNFGNDPAMLGGDR